MAPGKSNLQCRQRIALAFGLIAVCVGSLVFGFCNQAAAQTKSESKSVEVNLEALQSTNLGLPVGRSAYDKSIAEWKVVYKDILQAYFDFVLCEEYESEEIKTRFLDLKRKGDLLMGETITNAALCLNEVEQADDELVDLLTGLPDRYYKAGKFEKAALVSIALLKHKPTDSGLMFHAIRSTFLSNQFAETKKLIDQYKVLHGEVPTELRPINEFLDPILVAWERETVLRKKEAEEDKLPRIEFETERGNIVVELFENEAPIVVNNLIFLVESGTFFRDMEFYMVLDHQFAATGRKDEDFRAYPLGKITEFNRSNARNHFRGSFSLYISPTDSAILTECKFVRAPMPELDSTAIVVGRIIEGMDIVDQIPANYKVGAGGVPGKINVSREEPLLGAKVIRKDPNKIYKPILER